MKTIYLILLFILPLCGNAQTEKPFVIPELQQWTSEEGVFTPEKTISISIPTNQTKELMPIASQFAADLKAMFQINTKITAEKTPKKGIVLTLDKLARENAEAYTLHSTHTLISVKANTPTGVLWATRTILQIMEQTAEHSVPCGVAEDYPAYPMRGFMLDVARKYFSIEYLRDLIHIMSYYKMNTFQIHLNDNGFKQYFDEDWNKTYAAFRLESTTYPGLAAKDGHYTKKEFQQLQLDALALGVTIIPEIDAPAHTLAFAHYLPEIGSQKYGMDHLDLFNPKTYQFMDALFKEYLEGENPVFVNPYVHIGTDEYSNKDTAVVEKFRYFTDHYIRHIESFGKKAMLWGALTHAQGKTPVKVENVLMNCWYNGYADPRKMIEQGYDVVSIPDGVVYIVPATGYYHDYLNIKHIYEKWTPNMIGNQTFEEQHPQIKGGMFAVWNDHCGNGISFQDVHHRIMPAMQTLAVKMWNSKHTTTPFEQFNTKRTLISEAPGINILARPEDGKTGIIFECKNPHKNYKPILSDIGYNYSVEFNILAGENPKATPLFQSTHATVYLCDPQEGKLGYSRDGYNYRFNYIVPTDKQIHIAIKGTNKATQLWVDGQLVESLDIIDYKGQPENMKQKMKWVQTLVFPLAEIGKINGKISNLKVIVQ